MKLSKTLKLALASIASNKMRSFLTMLGIVIGVAAVIILVSLMGGVSAQVTDAFETIGTNTVIVTIIPRGGNRVVRASDLYKLMEENPDVITYITPRVTLKGSVKSRESTDALKTTSITGVSEQHFSIGNLNLATGRFLQFVDVEKQLNSCVIGTYVAEQEFGKLDCLGQTIKINGMPFKVVGVLEEIAGSEEGGVDDCVFIPYTVAAKMTWTSVITEYTVAAKSDAEVNQVVEILKVRLNEILGSSDNYRLISMKEVLEQVEKITGTFRLALVCIAGISLVVGGIGIMNIMLVSVTERTREIGIRKSLGAKRKNILQQFVIEAGTISGIGGILGIVFGASVAYLIGKALKLTVTPSFAAVAVAFSVSVGIGIIFGLLPASKASKLNPIDALRFE